MNTRTRACVAEMTGVYPEGMRSGGAERRGGGDKGVWARGSDGIGREPDDESIELFARYQ